MDSSAHRSLRLLQKFTLFLLTTLGCLALILRAVPLLVHPTLHVDESYYLGAARAILAGDPLLTTYGFDKLFLLPFLLVPGILFAGENAVGFRVVGLAFSIAGVFLLRDCLRLATVRTDATIQAARRSESFAQEVVILLLSFGVFLQPLVMAHGISAMAEPSLLFFLLLGLRNLLRSRPVGASSRWSVSWTLASLVKLSSVMWLPLFLGGEWIARNPASSPARPLSETLRAFVQLFWKQTKWLWFAALFFMAMNRQKFAGLLWFNHLGQSGDVKTGFASRALFWITSLQQATGGFSALLWLLIAVSLALSLTNADDRRSSAGRWRIVILGSVFLHMIGLPLSGAPLYERYLVILMPQMAVATLVALLHLARFVPRTWSTRVRWIAPGFFACATILFAIAHTPAPLQPNPEKGRALEAMRDLLPAGAGLYSPHLWETRPFENRTWLRDTCADLTCLWRARPRAFARNQFVLLNEGETYRLERAPLMIDHATSVTSGEAQAPTRKSIVFKLKRNLDEALANRIRLKDPSIQLKWTIARRTVEPLQKKESEGLSEIGRRNLLEGLPVTITTEIKGHGVRVTGQILLIDPYDPRETEFDPGVALKIDTVESQDRPGMNFADLAAVIWKGRILKLSRIEMPHEVAINAKILWRLLEVSDDHNAVSVQEERL